MVNSASLSTPLLLKKKSGLLYTGKLRKIISLLLLLALSAVANATYTDYIGAGHDAGVTVTTCVDDDEADGGKTVDGSGLSGPSGTNFILHSGQFPGLSERI